MKAYTIRMAVSIAVAVLAMSGAAFAGQAQAGNAEPVPSSDTNSWTYRQALETGSLPADHAPVLSVNGLRATVPSVEIGGQSYRVAIDTP